MLQKTKVKKLINQQGYKVSSDSFDSLEKYTSEILIKLLKNVQQDGMKTLMPHHIPFNTEEKKTQAGCTRCLKLKDQTIQWGEAVQEECIKIARKFARSF